MNSVRTVLLVIAIFCRIKNVGAQTSSPSENAMLYADSFLKSFRNNHFEVYTDLNYPGVIAYYGGNKNFQEYVHRARALCNTEIQEDITLIQIVHDNSEYQCVISKTCETTIDQRKAQIITYMVGQSKDEGHTWKFIDVAQSSPGNLVYIMPDISAELTIPQRQVIF